MNLVGGTILHFGDAYISCVLCFYIKKYVYMVNLQLVAVYPYMVCPEDKT